MSYLGDSNNSPHFIPGVDDQGLDPAAGPPQPPSIPRAGTGSAPMSRIPPPIRRPASSTNIQSSAAASSSAPLSPIPTPPPVPALRKANPPPPPTSLPLPQSPASPPPLPSLGPATPASVSARQRPMSTLHWSPISPAGAGGPGSGAEQRFALLEDRYATYQPSPGSEAIIPGERQLRIHNEARQQICQGNGIPKDLTEYFNNLPTSVRDCVTAFSQSWVTIVDETDAKLVSQVPIDGYIPEGSSAATIASSSSSSSSNVDADMGVALFRSDGIRERRRRKKHAKLPRKPSSATERHTAPSLLHAPGGSSPTPATPSLGEVVSKLGSSVLVSEAAEHGIFDNKFLQETFSDSEYRAALAQLQPPSQIFAATQPLPAARSSNRSCPRPRYPRLSPQLRLLVEAKQVSIEFGNNFEAYFCTLALFEISQKQVLRLTEDFHFDINPPGLMQSLNSVSKVRVTPDPRTQLTQCVFELVNPNPDVHLVLRINRVARGLDLPQEKLYGPYMKPKSKTKNLPKLEKEMMDAIQEDGFNLRQPLCWGAVPLTSDTGVLPIVKITDLHPIRGSVSDTLLMDVLKEKDTKKDRLLGDFSFTIVPLSAESFEALPGRCFNPVLPLEPADGRPAQQLIKVLRGFGSWNTLTTPPDHYVNSLYLYPESVSLKPGASVYIEMVLKSSEGESSACMAFASPAYSHLVHTSEYITPASLKEKKPHFWEEVKIDVPALLTTRHHILLKFCTVAGGKKKDSSVLGYAVIPLWRCVDASKQQLLPSILPDGRYTVAVHTGSVVASYLQNVANNYPMPAGQQTKSKAKVPTFTFRLRFISSVMTNDTKLAPFFESLQDDASDNDSKGMAGWDFFLGKSLEDAVNGIRLIPNRLCAQFFPVLFNQLFRVMCTRAEETAKTAMPVIIDLVKQVSVALGAHFIDFLTVYINHAFQNPAAAKRPVFAEVLRHLVALVDQDHPSLRNFEHWWFFLEIIVKSLALYRISSGASRKEVCSPEFYGDLFRLIHLLFAPRRIVSSFYGRCSAAISCPAFFANLLHLCDRGIITELVHQYLEKISPGPQNAHLTQLLSSRAAAEPAVLLNDSAGVGEPDDGPLDHASSSTDVRTRRPLTRFKSGSNLAGMEITTGGAAATSRVAVPAAPPLSPRLGEKVSLAAEGSVDDLSKLMVLDDDESCDVDFMLLNTKFDVLTHLAEDPLFFTWNLPTLATLSEVSTLAQLTPSFWDRYPLCGEIIETCRQSLETETADKPANVGQLIRNSILNFRNILHNHLVNERVHNNKPLNLELICGMYFPFVQLIVKGKNRLDPASFAEWLRCFLFILGHCSPQLLVDYWRLETHNALANFLSLLKMSLQQFDTNRNSPVPDAVIVIVGNVTKLFVDTFREKLELDQFLMDSLFQVVVGMLKTEVPSRAMVGYLLLKLYLQYFPRVLFLNRNNYCLNLVFQVFRHLNAQSPRLRQLGASVFLLLLKSNYATEGGFGRMKVYAPVAISQLVGGKASTRDAENLQGSLQSIADRLEVSLGSASPAAVDDVKDAISKMISLIQYTHTISQVTSADPDLTADLYSKIAKSYVNSPDTRVQWLENLANHHQARGDHLEAAICLIHYASLVVQFLETYGKRGTAQQPAAAVAASSVPSLTTSSSFAAATLASSSSSSSSCEPKAVPVDNSHFVLVAPNVYAETGLPVLDLETNEQFQLGDVWSKAGLCALLSRASQLVEQSTYQELSLELYSMLSLIYKSMRDYSNLTVTIQAYQAAVTKLIQLNKGTRILARFYRVSFYGAKAGELNGREYIYKRGAASTLQLFTREMEDALLRLVESPDEVVRLDNRAIKVEELDPKKAYYQVAAVKPYTEKGTKSIFEQHFAINKFIFESVYEKTQKKKTIFSTEKFFPYSKTRLPVVSKEDIVLSPIESAIENLRERSDAVTAEMQSNPPNINRLQQIIQGSVVPTVNEGPLGICNDFLAADKVDQFDAVHISDLKENLSRLIKQCGFAIKLLARLITDESKPLQDVFEKKYEELKVTLRTFGVSC